MSTTQKSLGLLRIVMGWIFLWAFVDKLVGFGYATATDKSWLNGVSPTVGYLKFATHGPLASWFQAIAGQAWVDWFYMIGLLLIGVALILGIATRLAAISGTIMMLLFFLSALPPEHNILVDEHIVYALVLIILASENAGLYVGYGQKWQKLKIVSYTPWLK